MIDFLIVGAGLFGSIIARELHDDGYRVLVVEKEDHVGGMVYTEDVGGITVHKYGAHIFRTDNINLWNYVNMFSPFVPYIHTPMAKYGSRVFNLPFNMNTFNQLWGTILPESAKVMIDCQRVPKDNPQNLEEYALSVVGRDIYNTFIKGYTEKQWGKPCSELPVETMKRIPIRFTYDNNYYSGKMYSGIPVFGYTQFIRSILKDVPYICGFNDKSSFRKNYMAEKIIYTGCIDDFFDYRFGALGYRSLQFRQEYLSYTDNYQGVSVMNYTSADVPYTRIIEHKHFLGEKVNHTVITKEYPAVYSIGNSKPYYPMLDNKNRALYNKYVQYASEKRPDIIFCGRLGSYAYYDMEDTILNALKLYKSLI